MKWFRHSKNLYSGFFRAGAQGALAYKLNFLGYFIGESLYCFVMYFMWKSVFEASGENTFMGFTMLDMTIYVFIANIVVFLTNTDSTQMLAEEIRDGSIIMRMIKPVNVDLSILATELGDKVALSALVFLPVIFGIEIYRYLVLGYMAFNLGLFLAFIFSTILSYILAFYLNLIFGYLAFWLMNIWGFTILKTSIISFFSGAFIPIAFFPGVVKEIFELLPFSSMVYTPVMVYMGKLTGMQLMWAYIKQIVWVLVFIGVAKLIWNWAEKRLAVQGG